MTRSLTINPAMTVMEKFADKILDPRKLRSVALAGLFCSLPLGATASGETAAKLQSLPRRLAMVLSTAAPMAHLHASQTLDIALGFPLQNQPSLVGLVQDLYNPASTNFHRFLNPQEFTRRFGTSEADYQRAIGFVQSTGLVVTQTHSNRMILNVRGSVSDIERVLHLNMMVYQHPTENRVFYAPDRDPSLELAVPLLNINGLENATQPKPNTRPNLDQGQPGPLPLAGSGTRGALMGKDFRAAYAPGVTLGGSGQKVALVEFDGYYLSDIAQYAKLAGLHGVPLRNVLLDFFDGIPGENNSEVALDIEMVLSMAPNVSEITVYEAGPYGSHEDVLNAIANDNLASQISCSWTWSTYDPIVDQILLQFAAQGQSFFSASGDSDAYRGWVPYPAANPYATSVGGTTLTTTRPSGAWSSEQAWNWGNGTGSSGGFSYDYSIPAYQQGMDFTAGQGSADLRNIPDVAMVADNVLVVYNNGQTDTFGGTSCAAPLWAGFMALANQYALQKSQSLIGFANPSLYAIGRSENYNSCFHDIATGNNFDATGTGYAAVTGYDLCTGWGSPKGMNLIRALASPPQQARLTPLNMSNEGAFQLSFSSQPGSTYVVQASIDLQEWASLATLTATGTDTIFTDSESAQMPHRFYRVLVQR